MKDMYSSHHEGEEEGMKRVPFRSTSIRLRRRRDQAKREFLVNRRSGDFGYQTSAGQGEWQESKENFSRRDGREDRRDTRSDIQEKIRNRSSMIEFKNFGLIDSPPNPELNPRHSYYLDSRQEFNQKEDQSSKLYQRLNRADGHNGRRRQARGNDGGIYSRFSSQGEPVSLPLNIREQKVNRNPDKDLKRTILWIQKDRLFSRWKERLLIIKEECLSIYKKSELNSVEPNDIILKIGLVDVDDVKLEERRGYLIVALSVQKEGKILLRRTENIRALYVMLKMLTAESQVRMRSAEEFWSQRKLNESSELEDWLLSRQVYGSFRQRRSKSEERSKVSTNRNSSSKPQQSSSEKNFKLRKSLMMGPPPTSEDSGNSSLNTSTTDSRKSRRGQILMDARIAAENAGGIEYNNSGRLNRAKMNRNCRDF